MLKCSSRRFSGCVLLWIAHLVLGGMLRAQDETVAPPPPQDLPIIDDTVVTADPFPRAPLSADVTVTANRTEARRSSVGSAVTVITGDEIRRQRRVSVLEVLRNVPGLDIVQSGGPGRQASGFLRGANSNQTKVLLDGIWMNDPSANRAFDFSNIAVDNIERIEIVRGPQSTLYGSDAMGGVINIITRRGSGPARFQLGAMGGSFSTQQQYGSVSGGNESVYYSFTGSFFDTDGFTAAERGSEKDGFRMGTASGRAGWIINESIDVDYVFRYIDSDSRFDSVQFIPGTGSVPVDGIGNSAPSESFFSRIQVRSLSLDGAIEQKVGFNYTNYNRASLTPTFDSFFNGDTEMVDYQMNVNVIDEEEIQDVFTVGAMYMQESARTSNTFAPIPAERALFDRAAYLQNTLILGNRWSLTAGTRWDDYSRAGAANTYRLTSRYEIPDVETAIHGSFGTGFRAPSINELFGFAGNPDLRPEESKGWDVGIEQPFFDDRLVVDATYFRNDFDNLIVFVLTNPPFDGQLFNVATATAHGVELTGTWEIQPGTRFTAAYTRTDSLGRDPSSGANTSLLRRPRNKFSLMLDQDLAGGKANVNVRMRYVGQRNDVSPNFGDPPIKLDDYIVVDAALGYDLSRNLQLFARVDNVSDSNYEEIFGFNAPRISVYAGALVTWGGQ